MPITFEVGPPLIISGRAEETKTKLRLDSMRVFNTYLGRLAIRARIEYDEVLGNISGALRNSIQAQPAELKGNMITGKVTWGGGASKEYAETLERGGKAMYVIYPVNAKYLAWKYTGRRIEVRKTKQGAKELVLRERAKGTFSATYGGGKNAYTKFGNLPYKREATGSKGWIVRAYVFHPPATARHFMQKALYEARYSHGLSLLEMLAEARIFKGLEPRD